MKKNLKAITLTLVVMMGLTACTPNEKTGEMDALAKIKEQGFITMATSPDFAPYEFMDLTKSGEEAIVGCDVELGKYIAEYIGVDLKVESMDFGACQAATSVGKVDMSISGYAKTPEREENMECSDYFNYSPIEEQTTSQGIVVLKENAATLNTEESFTGKTIAAQNGSLQYNLATAQLPEATIESISTINDGMLMLLSGKVDGVASFTDTAEQIFKNYDNMQMSEFYFVSEGDGNVVIAKKGETALMEEINKAIAKAAEEGKYAEWLTECSALADELGVE